MFRSLGRSWWGTLFVFSVWLASLGCGGGAGGGSTSGGTGGSTSGSSGGSTSYTNLLVNPGFESPIGSEWVADPSVANQGLAYRSQLVVHSGQYSLKLVPTKLNVPDPANNDFGLAQQIPVAPYVGKSLYFSGWMFAKDGATAVLRLVAITSDNKIYLRELQQDSSATGMVQHWDILDLPNDPKLSSLFIFCSVHGATGSVSFDDVVVSADHPLITAKLGQYDPGPDLSADVQVHTGQTIRLIPRSIYGMNLEWINDGQGLWNEQQNSLDPTLMQEISDLGATGWRFPGGLFADYYHWADGVGPRAQRPAVIPGPGGQPTANNFGTDELMDLAAKTNSQPVITVNPLTGTAQEAANWVSYVNNGTRHVDNWEIGNELYLEFPVGNSLTGPTFQVSPQEYAQKFLDYATAMRAADPTIKLGADIEFNYAVSALRLHPDWAQIVLQQAGPQIDFVSVHNGFAPALSVDGGWDVRTVYSAMLAAPVLVQNSLNQLSGVIDANAGPNSARIGISVSEWGPFFDTNPSDRFIDHVKTLGSALYTASLLKVLVENPRVQIASGFKLVDRQTQGWIGDRQGALVPKAPYYALQLFTQHFGPVAVQTSVTSPTYWTRSIGWAEEVQSAPYLDVVSSVDNEFQNVYLIGVNKHFDRAIQATIHLDTVSVTGPGTTWTLSGTGIDANTGTGVPAGSIAQQSVADPDGRFNLGGPNEIWVTSAPLSVTGKDFTYVFPAHSVTAIVLPTQVSASAQASKQK